MKTPYDKTNANYSNMAHMAAREVVYPAIFGTESLAYEDCTLAENARSRILDGEMAVDRIVRVSTSLLGAPIVFTVQERFRRPGNTRYQDLTITEWNKASNLPSELYKITAGLFLYAYYDDKSFQFTDAICMHVSVLLHALVRNAIEYKRGHNPRSQQTFLAFKFCDLEQAHAVMWRME